jgi:hypothetical protein
MNVLVPVSLIASSVPPSLAEAELDAALSFAEREKSAATLRAYRSDWRIFTAWCSARGLEVLPAAPETVAAFLAAEAKAGVKTSTIGQRCAAIGYAHKLGGHREPPTTAEALQAIWTSCRHLRGRQSPSPSPRSCRVLSAGRKRNRDPKSD